MGRRTQNTQTAQTTEPEVEAQVTPEPEATEAESTPPTPEELLAEVERLRAELAEAQSRPTRKPRVKRPSPKQQRLQAYLREHPDASIGEACREAGATETSHGLVFRMIEDGYLRVSVPEAEESTDEPEGESAPTEETAEAEVA